MADARPKRRWGFVILYLLGAAACSLGVYAAFNGGAWHESLILFCAGLIIMHGPRRLIFRAGVQRSRDEIVCRYRPLYEGLTYMWGIVMPAFGIAGVAAGFAPGSPVWWRFGGIFILLLCPLGVFGIARMGRRGLLCVTPSTLKIRGSAYVGEGSVITEIHRDQVQAINPARDPRWNWLQVELVYRDANMVDTTKTVKLGPRVSVQPVALLNGLTVWKDGADDDPGELLDRIERIFRRRSTAGT